MHRNTFVTGFIIYFRHLSVAEVILWPVETNICFTSSFEMYLNSVCRSCYILRFLSTRNHLKCILILVLRSTGSVDDFLCSAATQGNLISIHKYSWLLVKHAPKKRKKVFNSLCAWAIISYTHGIQFLRWNKGKNCSNPKEKTTTILAWFVLLTRVWIFKSLFSPQTSAIECC